ncbi:TPM domain-containing protein [Polaromonas sp.]|uniref:TPM domain-containing protein n=1 Tax=Polaromonas sp. TaxID=1869339 RepID=UPI0017A17FB4|nr:TPM domain-containing protein [Polaromonas sp.]NMM08595.1 TPM domain-containing protein [Polaromonas sp.]
MNKLALLSKHLWLDASDSQRAIPPDMLNRLTERVAASEQRHSGQIRICVEASLPTSYLLRLNAENTLSALVRQRAVMMFGKLGVWDTEHNNGVLIYLLLAEHAIEIVADRGLMRHVDAAQWQAMVARMASAFKDKRYEDGLTQALEESSAVLMAHFARSAAARDHPNELPDTPHLE